MKGNPVFLSLYLRFSILQYLTLSLLSSIYTLPPPNPHHNLPTLPSRLQALGDPEFLPVDNEFLSVLGRDVSLPKEFKDNYEHWLEREVFGSAIDWDCLLLPVKY